jgi:hypothetical protein
MYAACIPIILFGVLPEFMNYIVRVVLWQCEES